MIYCKYINTKIQAYENICCKPSVYINPKNKRCDIVKVKNVPPPILIATAGNISAPFRFAFWH